MQLFVVIFSGFQAGKKQYFQESGNGISITTTNQLSSSNHNCSDLSRANTSFNIGHFSQV
jgi:hypothetical protein